MPNQHGETIWERIHALPVRTVALAQPTRAQQPPALLIGAPGRLRSRAQDQSFYYTSLHTLGQDEWQLKGVEDDVCALALSEDGTLLAAGSVDRMVAVYNTKTHAKIWEFKTQRDVTGLSMSANGMALAVTSLDGKCRLFSTLSNIPLYTLSASSPFLCVAVALDGRYAVVGTPSGDVFVIDAYGQAAMHDRTQRTGEVAGVAINDAGQLLAIVSNQDRRLQLCKLNGQQCWSVELASPGRGVAMNVDGSRIAAVTENGTVIMCQGDNGAEIWRRHLGQEARSIAMTRDAQYLVVGSENGTVTVLNTGEATPVSHPRDASDAVAWMIPRLLRDAYLDSPHRAVCLWFDLFDCGFERGHIAMCKALVDEVYDKPYGMTAREARGMQTRAAMLALLEGITLHKAGRLEEARLYYTKALADYDKAGAITGISQAQSLLEIDFAPEALEQFAYPRIDENSETFLQLRLKDIRNVSERLRVVRSARDCGWVTTLGKLVNESDDVANGQIESSAVRASAIAACEHMQPGLRSPVLVAALGDAHWLVRLCAASQLRRAARKPESRALIRDRYQHELEAALARESVSEVRDEITLLSQEVA